MRIDKSDKDAELSDEEQDRDKGGENRGKEGLMAGEYKEEKGRDQEEG